MEVLNIVNCPHKINVRELADIKQCYKIVTSKIHKQETVCYIRMFGIRRIWN